MHVTDCSFTMFLLLLLLHASTATERPIIGVVSQWYRHDYFPNLPPADNHTSYIAARWPPSHPV